MAYARSLSTRATLIARRYQPSLAYIAHDDDRKHKSLDESQSYQRPTSFAQQRSFGTGFGSFSQDRRCSHFFIFPSAGSSFCRYMSTTDGDGSDKIELMSDVLNDTTVEAVASQVPVVNEVAIAAADSWLPVAALQHFIDAVHSFTGFNWWVSLIVSTLLIRSATLPLLVNQLKSTSKLTLIRPHLEEIKQEVQDQGMDPRAVAEGQEKMKRLFKEHGVSPLTPLKGLFIQGPIFISFFLAISNMVEKVPSFKSGGAYWFVDLTTPDSLYIFPILAGLSFLITVECNVQEGMEGNPAASTMKNVFRVLAVFTVPFTASFPKAIFCYWVTSNLFSLAYGLVLKAPGVKKFLGLPEISVRPPSNSAPQPSFDLFSAIKQAKTGAQQSISPPVEPTPKVSNQRISSSSVMSQRIRSLEKQVKGRKKKNNK